MSRKLFGSAVLLLILAFAKGGAASPAFVGNTGGTRVASAADTSSSGPVATGSSTVTSNDVDLLSVFRPVHSLGFDFYGDESKDKAKGKDCDHDKDDKDCKDKDKECDGDHDKDDKNCKTYCMNSEGHKTSVIDNGKGSCKCVLDHGIIDKKDGTCKCAGKGCPPISR